MDPNKIILTPLQIEVINGMADNSIFIISHQDALKDSFDNAIQIETDENGFSKILV